MRDSIPPVVVAIALAPAAASAVVTVHVGRYDILPGQPASVDVWLENVDTTTQRIDAFTVAVDGPFNQSDGVRFAPPPGLPSAAHPYIFRDSPGSVPEDFASTYNRMQVGAAVTGTGPFIADGEGLFSIPVIIPAGFPFGHYPFVIDPAALSLGGPEPIVAVAGPPGGITYIPEPTAVGAVALGLLMLARTRRPVRPSLPSPADSQQLK